ncbi:hypothetical protein R1sor_016506 [Riccia sorocarpa]|uniref:Cupin type-1 domain-containing protein n=1 Tax=Riccia sorocarpa TaxID=122646 RepID=A0ABD3HF80_9MARC
MRSLPSTAVIVFLCLAAFVVLSADAADPEEIRDFAPPPPGTKLDGTFFTSPLLRNINVDKGAFANVTPVNVINFPALSGLGVSNALLVYPPGSVNVPHTHPRGTETLFIIEGTLEINKSKKTVRAYAAFSSTNPGLVSLPRTLFGVNTDVEVLTKSFEVSPDIVKTLSAQQP